MGEVKVVCCQIDQVFLCLIVQGVLNLGSLYLRCIVERTADRLLLYDRETPDRGVKHESSKF